MVRNVDNERREGALDKSLMLMPAGWKMIILLSGCDGVYGGLTAASGSSH